MAVTTRNYPAGYSSDISRPLLQPAASMSFSATGTPSAPVQKPILNSVLPGQSQMTQAASNIINSSLVGLPSPSEARRANAYYGAASGIPGSEFIARRGFDLYNRQADERKARGLQDLLAFFSTFSGPALQQRSQDIQQGQFGASLAQQQAEFAANLAMQQAKLNAELQKFGYDPNRYRDVYHDTPALVWSGSGSGGETLTNFY